MQLNPFIPQTIKPEALSGMQVHAGIEVSIIRLDKIHDTVSGNKWLKLQGWLELAATRNRNGIMTAGGPWSNHLHAAAAWCHLHRLPFHAVVKGRDGIPTPMLDDVLAWKGKITWVNHTAFNDEAHWQNEAANSNMQWVPMGGDGPPGKAGVKKFFDQFAGFHFDELWCPIGTGTTLAGIASSAIGASTLIAFDPGIADKKVHEKLLEIAQSFTHRKIYVKQTALDKFGSISKQVLDNMNKFFDETGIPTDIIYTGKMIDCIMHEFLQPINCEKKSILLVHTGGLQGNRSLDAGDLKFMH